MSRFDYQKTKRTADRLIQRFGAPLTYTRSTGETFDPQTGTTTSTEESFVRETAWLDYDNDEIDGTIVQRGDARLVVQGELKVDDTVTRNGETWRVLRASPLEPAGVIVFTEAQVRH